MRRIWKNVKGSGIIWAMATAGFLLILVGGTLSIAYRYHLRSSGNAAARQAYLTAQSGVDLIVRPFTDGAEETKEILAYLEKNGAWLVEDVGFRAEMGVCSLNVILAQEEENVPRTVTVTATAVCEGKTRTVTATLIGVMERLGEEVSVPETPPPPEEEPALTWYLSAYTDGEEDGHEAR